MLRSCVSRPRPGVTGPALILCISLVALLAASSVGRSAPAAPAPRAPGASDRARAKQHFDRAEAHYERREFRQALSEYKAAMSFLRHPAFLFNIAQCHRHLGEYDQALFYYKLYLSRQPAAPNAAEVRQRVTQMTQLVEAQKQALRHQGRLSVVTFPAGAEVRLDRVDGPAAGTAPLVLTVAAGEHLLVVSLAGHRRALRKVQIPAGGVAVIDLRLEPLVAPRRDGDARPRERLRPVVETPPPRRVVAPPPPAGPVARTAPFYKRWWFWSGAALGALLVGAGVQMGLMALEDQRKWERYYYVQAQEDGKLHRTLADVFLFTGGAVLVSTLVAALVVGKGRPVETARPVVVAPACGPGSCALWVQGRF